ncbi:MAG: Holliday junction resolvase RuvX [Gammaproteobacteria bacterium]|nr:Holliday junction resolvase RuvX [Gammaproteobacteria bacterium]
MPDTPEKAAPETIVALDFGMRRIGVAVGQEVTGSANPVATISNGAAGPDWETLDGILQEWKPARLVVGLPLDADGQASAMSALVDGFVDELARFGLPVETIDERYSSAEAAAMLRNERALGIRGRIKKASIDAAAAALIAERWLQQRL